MDFFAIFAHMGFKKSKNKYIYVQTHFTTFQKDIITAECRNHKITVQTFIRSLVNNYFFKNYGSDMMTIAGNKRPLDKLFETVKENQYAGEPVRKYKKANKINFKKNENDEKSI